MNPDNFGKGGHKDKVDNRDYKWSEIGFGVVPFDWETTYNIETLLGVKLPAKNQNGSSSCGGQAWATYASVLEALDDKTFEERSAKYIYAQTAAPGGGTFGRDNCELFVKQGVARETLITSYENGLPPSEDFITRSEDITYESRIDASKDKALSYVMAAMDIDTVAQVIQNNKGCIIGVAGSNNGTWLSSNPQPPVEGANKWYHWVYAGKVRKQNGIKQIGIINSWGSIAEEGWQWLSENYFPTNIFQVWTMVFNTSSPVTGFKHTFSKSMAFGNSGEDVKFLQTALQVDGTFPKSVAPTGYYGTVTCKAVLDFQLKYKLAGVNYLLSLGGKNAGPLTIAQLNKLFS